MSSADVCKNVVEACVARFGKIDILVNSAGILIGGSIETMSMEDYDKTMDINVKALIHLTQKCLPYLIATKGELFLSPSNKTSTSSRLNIYSVQVMLSMLAVSLQQEASQGFYHTA